MHLPRRHFRLLSLAAFLLCGTAFLLFMGCGGPPDTTEMNILFVIIDTLRADHLGCYGYDRFTSPHLDALSRESILFTKAYSHSPWTLPSVASIFTSLAPHEHGISGWGQPLNRRHLTLAEQLQSAGFHTEAYVSHVIFKAKYNFDQGFSVYDVSVLKKGHPHQIATAAEISDLAISALDKPMPRPFFLWLHYFDPHGKYLNHDQYGFGSKRIDRYDSEIAHVDHHLGRVVRALQAKGIYNETIIVVAGDHGEEFLDHGGWEHTRTLYDEVLRIPLLIKIPGYRPDINRTPAAETDLAPTLLKLAGTAVPRAYQGIPFELHGGAQDTQSGRIIFAETQRYADKRGMIAWPWKLVHDRENKRTLLFDLENDPGERRNRTRERADVAGELYDALNTEYGSRSDAADTQPIPEELKTDLEQLGYLEP